MESSNSESSGNPESPESSKLENSNDLEKLKAQETDEVKEKPKEKPKPFIHVIPPVKQEMTLSEIVQTKVPKSWEAVFKAAENDLEELSTILQDQEKQHGVWYPLKKNLFRALELTALNEVRAVLVGMDPYYQIADDGEPRPTGCSFSVRKADSIPGSLKNIFTEIKNEYPTFQYPFHGCLDSWARQGILLLNRCLTVRPNDPGSHGAIWDGFLIHLLKAIDNVRPKCIFILLGREAQKIKKYLGDKVIILEAGHPSSRNAKGGFLGCGIFLKVNEHLVKMGEKPINWNLS